MATKKIGYSTEKLANNLGVKISNTQLKTNKIWKFEW